MNDIIDSFVLGTSSAERSKRTGTLSSPRLLQDFSIMTRARYEGLGHSGPVRRHSGSLRHPRWGVVYRIYPGVRLGY